MPLYDLVCTCGYNETDSQMSVSEYESAVCPKCGGKLTSKPNSLTFNLKGYGWTPRMSGPERFRTRDKVIGEARYTWKKNENDKKAHMERELDKKPKYYTT